MRRAHPLTYALARRAVERTPRIFARRDCTASGELLFPLYQLGFGQGEPIFQQPPVHPPKGPVPVDRLHQVELSFLEPGALILQTTRPPMNDLDEGPRRQVERAYTDLEHVTFEAWKPYVEYLARTHVRLGPQARSQVRAGFQGRREMSFLQRGWGAPYHELNAHDGRGWRKYRGERRSALFLLRLEELWPGGPGYLCAFGMDGCTTLVWCYQLARKLPDLLERPGFVLAELVLGGLPERATDLRFALDWQIEILVQQELSGLALA